MHLDTGHSMMEATFFNTWLSRIDKSVERFHTDKRFRPRSVRHQAARGAIRNIHAGISKYRAISEPSKVQTKNRRSRRFVHHPRGRRRGRPKPGMKSI